jgi:CDK-activating kinase assembly factor MAT1
VGKIFNRRQDEFETLLDWNNYLEEVEALVFDIVEGGPKARAQAEERLRLYREGNEREIEENRRAGLEEAEILKRREKAEREAARQRRLAELREEEDVKMDMEKSKRDVLNQLAMADGDAEKITRQAQKVILKKTSARRNLSENATESHSKAMDVGLTIRGLKKKEAPVVEKPYDPFGGMTLAPSRYVVQDDYDNEWLGNAKSDTRHMAGGYSMPEYYARTMFEAFAGLGVFIEDEMADRQSPAAEASGRQIKVDSRIEADDVF